MAKPEFPQWATEDQIDPISQQTNVIEPPIERKESGWTRHEVPPRQWLNWLARKTYEWLVYLDETRGQLEVVTVTTLPAASDNEGRMVYVSDETGGAVPAFSDGTDWRRVTDRNVVS